MFDPARHVPLRPSAWDAVEAATAIDEIAADAIAHFDPQRFWPAHPQDDNVADGNASLYIGAAGTIWALDYLARIGATKARYDFRPALPGLLAAIRDQLPKLGYHDTHGSLHFGDMGGALVAMRLDPAPTYADAIHERAEANADQPIRELMWGLPGSMLACVAMAEITGEARWQSLYAAQAARLLGDLAETEKGPLWTQDLYGSHARWLGPVHGYAGNMVPLIRGWHWLTEAQRAQVADAVPRTLAGTAWRSELGATWQGVVESTRPPDLCQHCHGAPGMVTTFADAPVRLAAARRAAHRRRKLHLGRRPAGKRLQPLPRHRRQRLCLPQALPPNQGHGLARSRPRLRHDGHRPVPRSPRAGRTRPLHALDRRRGPRLLPVGLSRRRAALPVHRRVLSRSAGEPTRPPVIPNGATRAKGEQRSDPGPWAASTRCGRSRIVSAAPRHPG